MSCGITLNCSQVTGAHNNHQTHVILSTVTYSEFS